SRSQGSWALGGRDREEASTRRVEEEARRHHGTAVPPRLLVDGLRRHGSSPLQKKHIESAVAWRRRRHMTGSCRRHSRTARTKVYFVPLAWESTGGATETVHETIRPRSEPRRLPSPSF